MALAGGDVRGDAALWGGHLHRRSPSHARGAASRLAEHQQAAQHAVQSVAFRVPAPFAAVDLADVELHEHYARGDFSEG
eukprot:gene8434-2165_t